MEDLYELVFKERDVASTCTVCGVKLFNYHTFLEKYLYSTGRHVAFPVSYIHFVFDKLHDEYPYVNEDHALVLHHISYQDDITIPVCYKCHWEIHNGKHKKYLPVDTKPLILEKP